MIHLVHIALEGFSALPSLLQISHTLTHARCLFPFFLCFTSPLPSVGCLCIRSFVFFYFSTDFPFRALCFSADLVFNCFRVRIFFFFHLGHDRRCTPWLGGAVPMPVLFYFGYRYGLLSFHLFFIFYPRTIRAWFVTTDETEAASLCENQ